jgi:hypothetical protein
MDEELQSILDAPDEPITGESGERFVLPTPLPEDAELAAILEAPETNAAAGKEQAISRQLSPQPIPENRGDLMQFLSQSTSKGMSPFITGEAGLRMIMDPSYTIEQASKHVETEEMKKNIMGTDAYAKMYGDFHPMTMTGKSLELAPFMGANVFAAGIGGGLGFLGGSAAALLTGGAAAPAIPALTAGGAAAGAFALSALTMGGGMFYELSKMKMPRDAALGGALASGAINGALELIGVGVLAKFVGETGKLWFKTPMGKKLLTEQMIKFTEALTGETSVEVAQGLTDSLIKFGTNMAQGPEYAGQYPIEKIGEEVAETIKASLQGLPGIMLGGNVAGASFGKAVGTFAQKVIDVENEKIKKRREDFERRRQEGIQQEQLEVSARIVRQQERQASAAMRNAQRAAERQAEAERATPEVEEIEQLSPEKQLERYNEIITETFETAKALREEINNETDEARKEQLRQDLGKENRRLRRFYALRRELQTELVNDQVDAIIKAAENDFIVDAEEQALVDERGEAETRLQFAENKVDEIKEQRKKLDENYKAATNKIKGQLTDLREDNEQAKSELRQSEIAATEARADLISAGEKLAEANQSEDAKAIEAATEEHSAAEQKLRDAQKNLAEAKDAVKPTQEKLKEKRKEAKKLRADYVAEKQRLSRKRNVYEEKVRSWKDRIAEISKELVAMDKSPERIKRNQTLLTKMITGSDISKAGKAAFIAVIKEVQSNRQLARVADGFTYQKEDGTIVKVPGVKQRLLAIKEAEQKAEVVEALEKRLSQLKLQQSGKWRKSKFPTKQEALDIIKEFWEDESKAEDAITTVWTKHANGEHVTAAEQLAADIAFEFFATKRDAMNPQQVDVILAEVERLMDEGRAVRIADALAKVERTQEAVETMRERIGKFEEGTGKPKSWLEKYSMWQDQFGTHWMSWEGLQNIITQKTGGNNNFDLFDPFRLFAEERGKVQEWREKLNAIIVDSIPGVAPETVRQHIMAGDEVVKLPGFTRRVTVTAPDGTQQSYLEDKPEWYMSRNEAIQLKAFMNDRQLKDRLRDGGIKLQDGAVIKLSFEGDTPAGTSAEEVLTAFLDDGISLKLVDATHNFYSDYFQRVDEYAHSVTGVHLDKTENYGGTATADVTRTEFFDGLFRRATAKPNHIISRIDNSQPVVIGSFKEKLITHIEQTEHAIAFAEFEQLAPAVFGDNEVRQSIRNLYGEQTHDAIMNHIKDLIVGRYQFYSAQSNLAGYIRRNAFTVMLSGKPTQYAKQLTGMIAANMFVSWEDYVEGVIDFMLNPQAAIDVMNQSPVLRERAALINRDYRPNVTVADIGVLRGDPELKEVLSVLLQLGDLHAIYAGFWSVYRATLKNGNAENGVQPGDHEGAMREFERAFNTTQSSGTLDQLGALFRGTEIERALTIFQQQPTRMVEHIVTAWRRYKNAPTPEARSEAKIKLLKTIMIANAADTLYSAVVPIMMYGVSNDEARRRMLFNLFAKATLGPTSGMVVFGPLLQMTGAGIASAIDKKQKVYPGQSFLFTDLAEDYADQMKRLAKIPRGKFTAKDFVKTLRTAVKTYAMVAPPQAGGGLPLDSPELSPLAWLDNALPDNKK